MLLVKYIHINMDKIRRPKLYTLPDTLQAAQRLAAVPIAPARSALHLARLALLPVLFSLSVCAGLGSPPLGYMGRAGGGVVDTSRRKNSKKAFSLPTHPFFSAQNAPTPIVNLKNSAQK